MVSKETTLPWGTQTHTQRIMISCPKYNDRDLHRALDGHKMLKTWATFPPRLQRGHKPLKSQRVFFRAPFQVCEVGDMSPCSNSEGHRLSTPYQPPPRHTGSLSGKLVDLKWTWASSFLDATLLCAPQTSSFQTGGRPHTLRQLQEPTSPSFPALAGLSWAPSCSAPLRDTDECVITWACYSCSGVDPSSFHHGSARNTVK